MPGSTVHAASPVRLIVASLVTLAALQLSSAAQQVPTFRSRVDLVELDVSVLDGTRMPIRGLSREDFTVLEDGKPQEIAIFEAIDVPDPAPPPAAWMRDVTPDVDTNDTTVTRLWVVVLDDALIPADPFAIKTSLGVARQVIDRIGPHDLAALVFTTDSRKAQDFTNDRSKLLATLDQFHPGWASWSAPLKDIWSDVNADGQFHLGSVLTLRNVMETLSGLPHHRKALVWISPGFGLPTFDRQRGQSPDFDGMRGRSVGDAVTMMRVLEVGLDVMRLAKFANFPIYGVSPCGLTPVTTGAMTSLSKCAAATSAQSNLQGLSVGSGGRPFVGINEFTSEIGDIFAENSSYYLIGYYPTNATADGRERRIEVRTTRPGTDVRTRRGYVAPRRAPSPPKSMNEALARATAVPIPVGDMPMRATAAPFAIPGNDRAAAVAIAVGIREPVPAGASAAGATVTTDLRVSAYTTEGDHKGTHRSTVKVALRGGADGDAEYEALSRIDLPPGRFRLRIAAHNGAVAKTGTVTVDVIVPDFSKAALSVSGVVLGATPGLPSAPRDLFTGAWPIVPTTQREFGAIDRATAAFQIHQPAAPASAASVNIRVVNDTDRVVVSEEATVPAEQFVPRRTLNTAQFQYELPLSRLTPGRYLLTFEVNAQGRTVRRDVQFLVR